jgi:hypothetical protein
MNDHTERGAGGRQYGTSEKDKQTHTSENNTSIADLIGKGKHIRTVAVPAWVKRAVDEWTDAAKISTGALFRRVAD